MILMKHKICILVTVNKMTDSKGNSNDTKSEIVKFTHFLDTFILLFGALYYS